MSLADTPTGNRVQNEMAYLNNSDTPSSVGPQIYTEHYNKKAIIAIRNQQFFGQLANVEMMPKHLGKKMTVFDYVPVLDDRNQNDQGIDADGAMLVKGGWQAWDIDGVKIVTGTGWVVAANGFAGYFDTEANAFTAAGVGGYIDQDFGALYGGSKDVGVITSKLPALTEHGGRVNRIGYTRVIKSGTLVKQGFFSEYTQESLDFDNDSELMSHITTESLVAANEMTEDNIQKDLLNNAGIEHFAGAATSNATVDPEHATDPDILTYEALMRLQIELDDNKCPKSTKIITGSRMIDTRVVNSARYLYCGSEMIPTLERMEDLHGAPALKHVETYAAAGKVAVGEYGAIGQFRIIIVPEMMSWHGAGAAVATNPGYRETNGYYDVVPLLAVGSGSFSTIGFQTDGKTVKFKIIHKKPGYDTATAMDPYGEKGHYAIKWYYGMLVRRPEWIAVMKCAAEM